MIEQIILGSIQGIAEWLPVSSEAVLILAKKWFFHDSSDIGTLVSSALFLHFGTFLAALIYFREDVKKITTSIVRWNESTEETKKIVYFLFISTIISGAIGYVLLKILEGNTLRLSTIGGGITLFIGILLIITGVLQLLSPKGSKRVPTDIRRKDSVILGLVQGLAVLPGFSRSGLTVSALLLDKFNEETSLRLSFLMSMPIVLGGNIILNFSNPENFDPNMILGLLFSFIFGYLTIGTLLKIARKVNFGWFVIIFGLLSVLASIL